MLYGSLQILLQGKFVEVIDILENFPYFLSTLPIYTEEAF